MSAAMTGGCLCGAVRFEAAGPPLRMLDCFCSACRRVSGGGPAHLVMVAADGFRVVTGAPAAHSTRADSGAEVTRCFCRDCGAPLYSRPARFPGMVALKVGALDVDPGYAPSMSIWTGGAPAWAKPAADAPTYERGSKD